jgi:Zn-dependent protease
MIIPISIDDRNFKNLTWGGIITSLSGSIGNFLLATTAVLLLKCLFFFSMPNYILMSIMGILTTTLDIAILFGILNLIPLPPFDGGRILRYIIPQSHQHIVSWLEDYSLFIFLVIFFAPGISDAFFAMLSVTSIALKKLLLSLLL